MLAEILPPIFEHLQRRRMEEPPPKPHEVESNRAGEGAGMIAIAIYAAVIADTQGWISYGAVLARLMRDPSQFLNPFIWAPFLGWTLFVLSGTLLLGVGANRSSYAGRDMLIAAPAFLDFALGAALAYWAFGTNADLVIRIPAQALAVWLMSSAGTRCALAMRPVPVQHLPDPETQPDLPMSGPASPRDAGDAMTGRGQWSPPRFKD